MNTQRVELNTFLYQDKKKKIHFLDAIKNLFLFVKPSSDLEERKILFVCLYISSEEIGIWKKKFTNFIFLIKVIKIIS